MPLEGQALEKQSNEFNLEQGLPPRSEFHQNRKKKRKNNHLYLTKILFYSFILFMGAVFLYYLSF